MWNPSIQVKVPLMEQQHKFEELCCHYNEFYTQYAKLFVLMASLVEHFHVKYGIEEALIKGETSSTKGRLIMMVQVRPEYKLKYGEPGYSIRDKQAYRDDYFTDFTISVEGYHGEYTAVIGVKAMTEYGIMMAEIPRFDTDKYDEQDIPEWFVNAVKDFLK